MEGANEEYADEGPGRRIVTLQTSQALLNAPQVDIGPKKHDSKPVTDSFGRIPFSHPALSGLSGLTGEATDRTLDKSRLASLAERYGFDKVTRWKPKRVCRLTFSCLLGGRDNPSLCAR